MSKLTFHKTKLFWLLIFFHLFSLEIKADTEVRLITIGPGDAFWSAYGHTAIAIDDKVYGFGYFSFEDEGLVRSFIANQMYYDIGVSDFNQELELAEWQNRTFIVQKLNVSSAAKRQMADYLEWHNLPENQSYLYDYFVNNCATKIRDILDEAWQGSIKDKFNQLTDQSYFSQTFPAKKQAMMNFGIILGYGWSAYQQRTAWELMAFPVFLQSQMSLLPVDEISKAKIYYQSNEDNGLYSWLQTHWFLWVYVMVILLGLSCKLTRKLTSRYVFVSQFILGLVIAYFWFFSGHEITQWNFNILLFSPLVMLLVLTPKFKWLILAGYASWAVIALTLSAWYFMPVLLLHLYWLKVNESISK